MILCPLAEIADPGARGPFPLTVDGRPEQVFVVRMNGRVTAFVDRCPHARAPLEMAPDQFLDLSCSEILCSMHGARFDPASGRCLLGPCRGRSLQRIEVAIRDGMVVAVAGG